MRKRQPFKPNQALDREIAQHQAKRRAGLELLQAIGAQHGGARAGALVEAIASRPLGGDPEMLLAAMAARAGRN